MKPDTGPGFLDVLVVILSPMIVAGLMVIYLAGWWWTAAWRWVVGDDR